MADEMKRALEKIEALFIDFAEQRCTADYANSEVRNIATSLIDREIAATLKGLPPPCEHVWIVSVWERQQVRDPEDSALIYATGFMCSKCSIEKPI